MILKPWQVHGHWPKRPQTHSLGHRKQFLPGQLAALPPECSELIRLKNAALITWLVSPARREARSTSATSCQSSRSCLAGNTTDIPSPRIGGSAASKIRSYPFQFQICLVSSLFTPGPVISKPLLSIIGNYLSHQVQTTHLQLQIW